MKKRLFALLLVCVMVTALFAGCGTDKPADGTKGDGSANTNETVDTLSMYLYGSEGVANQKVLDELNKILAEEVHAKLEIKYIDWGDVATKYPLLWSSGEQFDMAYVSSGSSVPYAMLARQDVLVDITDMIDEYAPALKTELPENAWESMKVDDKIYGVPSSYSEFTAYGFITRSDLMEKYGIDKIESVEDMERYMDAALADGMVPLNGSPEVGNDLYRMFVALTDDWVNAPGLPLSELYLVGSLANPGEVFHPAFDERFVDLAVKIREWADKGYWGKDILASSRGDKDNFVNGLSASYITHQPDWTGTYGSMCEKLPGVGTEFYCFAEAQNKIVRKAGVENATGISVNSKHPEKCLQVIEKLMTDERCYNLFQYGIEGVQYEVVDGKVSKPEGYDSEVDGAGFSGWALRTDKYNIPAQSEDDRRYTLNEEWNKVAVDNPYVGFSFDNSKVSAELSAIANVNAQLGLQIMVGKTADDPATAVAKYREQLKAAGIDTVIEEVRTQYAAFLSNK